MQLSAFEVWSNAHLDFVLTAKPKESRFLDYKECLPTGKDADAELLKDVSAFANTQGGVILYGISEKNGEPTAAPGIVIDDEESVRLRLSQIIRANLDPSLSEFNFDFLSVEGGKVMALRIPPSPNAPHMIAKGSAKFYSRGVAGNTPMDAHEIKTAFLAGEEMTQKMDGFRRTRCSLIRENKLPIRLSESSVAVLHIMPFAAFQRPRNFSAKELFDAFNDARPPGNVSGSDHGILLEGVMQHSSTEDRKTWSYCLLFRNGCVEAVLPCLRVLPQNGARIIKEPSILAAFRDLIPAYVKCLGKLEIGPPFVFGLSYLDIGGASPYIPPEMDSGRSSRPISTHELHLPIYETNDMSLDSVAILKHFSDLLANETGRLSSRFFKDGKMVNLG